MRNETPKTNRYVFFLQATDEMRYPYESALQSISSRIAWYGTVEHLVEAGLRTTPLAVIVDLDLLKKPFISQLEQIRASFPNSDLIAQSSSDSAKLALQCLRAGFTDFLLKPISPEELAWSLRKALQRNEVFKKFEDSKTQLVRAIAQISSCTTATLVRMSTLEILTKFLGGSGSAWIEPDVSSASEWRVLGTTPRATPPAKVIAKLPHEKHWSGTMSPKVIVSTSKKTRKMVLPCQDSSHGMILVWGISHALKGSRVAHARMLIEHSSLCLTNLMKFEEIKQQTFVDDLTGLYNSRYLKFAINNAVTKSREHGQTFSVLFIDVDHFKSVNDRHGHMVGSDFLVAIGKTVRNTVRQIDPVFRYGGDEFVVILQGTPTVEAKEIAERIRKHVERRIFVFGSQRVQTTVSIGIANFPEHASDQETLLRLADEAMYSAKKTSRNSVHLALGLGNKATPALKITG